MEQFSAARPRARSHRARLSSLILIAILVAVTACQSTGPTPNPTADQPWTTPEPGIQVFLWGSPHVDRDLKLAKDAGFKFVKQMFQWNYIEEQEKGTYSWNEPDRLVQAAEEHGLEIMARVNSAPMWARPEGADPGVDGPPERMEDFGDFVGALAERYKGKIFAYQIWNEPNLARDWGGEPPNPAEYAEMLRIAYQAIKEADPDALVISAGLSPTTASGAIAMPDEVFLKEMYAAGAKPYFDMLGVHGAGFKSPPDADPAVVAKDPNLTNNDPSPEEAKRVYAFRHVEDLRKIMVEAGDEEKKISILEFGWTSDPRPDSPYQWHAVSEEEKAKYLVEAFIYARDHWQPWIGPMSTIYIAAPHWTAADEQLYWSITDENGNPRPAYEALKQLFN